MLGMLLLLLAPSVQDEEALWKAIDGGDADKVKELVESDVAKLHEILKKGRPVPDGAAGEHKGKVKDALDVETEVLTIVPRKYDKAAPAGVILVLHGLGAKQDQLKDTFRKYAEENNVIIVAPLAQPEQKDFRNEDYVETFKGQPLKQWWGYRDGGLAFSALRQVRRQYAVDDNRVAICGFSMGGFAAWNIGLRYPDRFCAILALGSGFSRTEFPGLRVDDKIRKLTLNAFNLSSYIVHGAEDAVVPVALARESRNRLRDLKYDHAYVEIPKEDHQLNLRDNAPISAGAAKWLKDKVRKPHPSEVKHYAIGNYCPQSYWVKIDEFAGPVAEVRATVKDQVIDFTATGAGRMTFFLDEGLVSLEKDVKIMSKGTKLFEGKVEPSISALLESWAGREDRDLLYRAKVTVVVK